MKEYLIKRPMLLCGITCIIIAAIGYYSKPAILLFGNINADR